jgi:phosphatidylinositol 3-kinase
MGDDFSEFKTYCCEAYNILRKSESVVLLLNLFSLMAHANIPDINVNQDYEKALLRFESKFALDLDDEAAMQHFNSEIHNSMNALLDPIFERVHRAAQYLR